MSGSKASYRPFPSFATWAAEALEVGPWNQALQAMETARLDAPEGSVESSLDFVTRMTAVDTNALEGLIVVDRGFTQSVAKRAVGWETSLNERGESARSLFETLLRAHELVLDIATKSLPITEATVRALHELACAAQSTYQVYTDHGWQKHRLIKGDYKKFPNNPSRSDGTEHSYAPVGETKSEMQRFVDEMQSELFCEAPAPVQAAFAHYGLVAVHPFPDGNGRVARLLASVFLVRATSVPLLVFADQKLRYLQALEAADQGNYSVFSKFTRERSVDAMNLFAEELKKAKELSGLRSDARNLYYGTSSHTHEEIDAAARRLLLMAKDESESRFAALTLHGLEIKAEVVAEGQVGPPKGFRKLGGKVHPVLSVAVVSLPPLRVQSTCNIRVLVARDTANSRIRLVDTASQSTMDIRVEDATPEITSAAMTRLGSWIESTIIALAKKTVELGRESREKTGWSTR